MTTSDLAQTPATPSPAAEPPALEYTGTYMGLEFTARTGGETFMTTAGGDTAPVPADLPHKVARYQSAIELGRQINSVVGSMFLPELAEVMGYIRAAHAADPYAPAAPLHEHAVIVAAVEAFAAVVEAGRAAGKAAEAAAGPAA